MIKNEAEIEEDVSASSHARRSDIAVRRGFATLADFSQANIPIINHLTAVKKSYLQRYPGTIPNDAKYSPLVVKETHC